MYCWATHSKLAKPELLPFSLSKKSVTTSLKGIVHVKITRDDFPEVSRWRWSKSSARCEKHRSIISPRYSSTEKLAQAIMLQLDGITFWDDDRSVDDRLLNLLHFWCRVADVGKFSGIAYGNDPAISIHHWIFQTKKKIKKRSRYLGMAQWEP